MGQSTHSNGHGAHSHDHGHDHAHGSGVQVTLTPRLLRPLMVGLHRSDVFSNYRSTFWGSYHPQILGGVLMLITGIVLLTSSPAGLVWLAWLLAGVGALILMVMALAARIVANFKKRRHTMLERVMDSVNWTGDEQVLDVGCGSGFLTTASAKHLTTGRVTAIDIWDQSSASGDEGRLLNNARAEGVADRIDVQTMDACRMTFEDNTFDVVTCSAAMHHIGVSQTDRHDALVHMVRVLKPGGRVIIADVEPIAGFTEQLFKGLKLESIERYGETPSIVVTGIKSG